jgi:hypothetical protein
MPSVQEGLGGGRSAARCRHGHKGGRWGSGEGNRLLLQWRDHGRRVSLRNTEPLRQGRQGAGGSIAEGAQGRQQDGQQDVDPVISCALTHAEQASLDHLQQGALEYACVTDTSPALSQNMRQHYCACGNSGRSIQT